MMRLWKSVNIDSIRNSYMQQAENKMAEQWVSQKVSNKCYHNFYG